MAKTKQDPIDDPSQFKLPPVVVGPTYASIMAAPESWVMATWQVQRLRSRFSGAGIKVAVLDTGVDYNHPDFAGVLKQHASSVPGESSWDGNSHGTHCCGSISSIQPSISVSKADLFSNKVLSNAGSGADTWIAKGIDWAIEQQVNIISMSLGSSSPAPLIEAAGKRAAAKGIWLFAAAGNEGQGGVGWPAQYDCFLSIAAIDRNFRVASFSSRGDKLDWAGPGVGITSCKPGGGYQDLSGTSMATPNIAGIAACYMDGLKQLKLPIPDVYDLRKQIAFRSGDLGTPGDDRDYGPGWASPLLLTLGLEADPPIPE